MKNILFLIGEFFFIIITTINTEYANLTNYVIISWNWRKWEDFGYCEKYKCLFTKDRKYLKDADAIFFNDFYNSKLKYGTKLIKRPKNTTLFVNSITESYRRLNHKKKLNKIIYPKNYFNLTYSYLPNADIELAVINKKWKLNNITREEINKIDKKINLIFNKKTEKIIWLVSNCKTPSGRENAIKQLKRYIKINQLGECTGKRIKLTPHETEELFNKHYFYIASENSDCKYYQTEKIYSRMPYTSIPIVNVRKLYENNIPKDSFIAMDDFKSPRKLVRYLKFLIKNKSKYLKFFDYRKLGWQTEEILTGKCHLCHDIVKFIQSNKKKVYFDIDDWLEKSTFCLHDNYVINFWKLNQRKLNLENKL
ncbi:Alpha-(1,3)-fucosyltransferase C [Strongyloides ratti]|uniref:Fucosyltransferase n=1 Tax=Strongyloides ratti TaxID=34506 RepID=A0A090LRB2_STRRB|nr:Alpha-(1,3)-fucosyltransferase C [Strongyloides ratti]CEF70136.1 Alpha-(1,3)-fucosyltransferase C [Strongyloides ratti]